MSRDSPDAGLELCRVCPNANWRVLVCGGDGTVGWVLSSIDKSSLKVCTLSSDDIAILCLMAISSLS